MRTNLLADLTDDGDVIELSDRHRLRLSITPDEYTSINDFDCYGRVYEGLPQVNYPGYETRPKGFDGAARKIGRHRDVWWQPPADATETLAHLLDDLLEYGFLCVSLSLLEVVQDSLGNEHEVVVASQGYGGIEPTEGAVSIVVPELFDDMMADLRRND